jgi:putative nucleotidyltransferase with HDIG domain
MGNPARIIVPLRNEVPPWATLFSDTLMMALQARDPYTFKHSQRVSWLASQLAETLGLSEYDQKVTRFSSLFHDIGKMGIPDKILHKPMRLTSDEEVIMRTHPIKSTEILRPLADVPFFADIMQPIRSHHERIDGQGYPDGLKNDEIPLIAKIILIADTFDAMTTDRPYRNGLSCDTAYQELQRHSGMQFDPEFTKIFIAKHQEWEKILKAA